MAIASGSLVEASDYNTIQTKVDSILGTGSGDKGYGQAVSSSQQSAGAVITDNVIVSTTASCKWPLTIDSNIPPG